MLNHLKHDEIEILQNVLRANPAFGVRISSLIKAYGAGQTFFNVWHQDYDTVLARLENNFFIYEGKIADFEEIAFFLSFNPYFHSLMGSAKTIEKFTPYFSDGYESQDFDFLILKEGFNIERGQADVEMLPSLRDVYSVMEKAKSEDFTVGDFTPWYVDISHRIRHGCARAYLLKNGGEPASVCLISAESDFAGLLSGVATIPQLRGRGFAAEVVKRACLDLTDCGKLPVLECLPSLTGYYGKLGFEKISTVKKLCVSNTIHD